MPSSEEVSKTADDAMDGVDGTSHKIADFGERTLRLTEDAIYVAVAALLVVGAGVLLVDAAMELGGITDKPDQAVLKLLDRLLLVFILVELIFAVRTTLARREIVAEPFLIVGIIVSIKEIILLSVEVANVLEGSPTTSGTRDPSEFAWQIGLLGFLVILLSVSVLLLRRKEREPAEGQENPQPDIEQARTSGT
ncbi:phosphate-starvation-inducible PsiE family protein [Kineosporia babensis]|uniref:Phosphate-starvation-inducible PsiE family protein n=1 Tax=Kineosporia babensis TaxID=499548 RepID=A0A9X1SRG9_9ACTN|nr:phosphate-starvation-inducible PsiE family protein [Kineosporia babensis]MCD5309609.1 phosphate-starvation-inducible PsiE family protein [Kineosporia babensis]